MHFIMQIAEFRARGEMLRSGAPCCCRGDWRRRPAALKVPGTPILCADCGVPRGGEMYLLPTTHYTGAAAAVELLLFEQASHLNI